MQLSVVSTLYNSAPFIPQLLSRLIAVIEELNIKEYEIILVNDGSPDESLKVALEERQKYPDKFIKIIQLSRNFGHHNAIVAGLRESRGDLVFLIDSDMDVDPEVLLVFHDYLSRNPHVDVVYGYIPQRKRADYISNIFWKIFKSMSKLNIRENPTTERLMRREYVDKLLQMGDYNLFLGGMFAWVGFDQVGIPVHRKSKRLRSNYNTIRKLSLFINAITSFTSYPLYLFFYFSIGVVSISFIYIVYIVVNKLLYPEKVLIGFSSIMASIYLMGGLLLLFISIVGLYVHKIFSQVQNRPLYIIKKIYE